MTYKTYYTTITILVCYFVVFFLVEGHVFTFVWG